MGRDNYSPGIFHHQSIYCWYRKGADYAEEDTYDIYVDQPADEPTALGDDPAVQDDGPIKEVQERAFTYGFDERWPSDMELVAKASM